MSTNTGSIPLTEQVLQALDTFDAAHIQAEERAAAFFEVKRLVGGNEADRKAAKAATDPAVYARLLEEYTVSERDKTAAAAHLERTEKQLNVLRELLNHETAQIEAATAVQLGHVADQEARTAGARTTMLELRARYPQPKPQPVPAGGIPEEDLPF